LTVIIVISSEPKHITRGYTILTPFKYDEFDLIKNRAVP
jgi:hypothetical protein